jgi:hypothetical protein
MDGQTELAIEQRADAEAFVEALFTLLGYVIYSLTSEKRQLQKDHMIELQNARAAMMGEIKDSRDAFGHVIVRITESNEKVSELSNIVLNELNRTIRSLSAGCAATQARLVTETIGMREVAEIMHADAATRHDDDATRTVDFATKHADDVTRHADDVAALVKSTVPKPQ